MSNKPKRPTVADFAAEFIRRAQSGEHPRARVRKAHVDLFLGELVRAGFKIAEACIDQIRDPELRDIIRTVLLSTASGAVLGAAVGSLAGPQGAKAGALIGAGVGLAVGVFAIVVKFRQEDGPAGPELVVEAAAA